MEDHESNRFSVFHSIQIAQAPLQTITLSDLCPALQALLAKYQDEVIVDEIIARKTEQGLWIANADLPDNEDGVTKD